MAVRLEIWRAPGAGTFQPLVSNVDVSTLSWSDPLNGLGHGAANTSTSRITEIIQRDPQNPASDRRALARLYADGQVAGTDAPLYEWFLDDHPDQLKGEALLSGPGVAAMLDGLIVAPFDYLPADLITRDPDWLWGVGADILHNSSFEDGTNLVTNPGFETGSTDPWYAGAVDGTSATLAIDTVTVDTGTYSAKCTPLLSEGGMSRTIRGFYPGKTYTGIARIRAGAGKTMQIGVGGPQSISGGNRVLFIEAGPSGYQYEAQTDFVGTGAFETVNFSFTAGSGQTAGHLSIRDASATPAVFYVDMITITGFGVGMDPWQPTNPDLVTVFEASTDVAADDGSYVGKVTADYGAGIFQAVDAVTQGALYTSSIRVRNTAGSAVWGLELRDQIGTRLAQDTVTTTTSWQTLSVSAVMPLDLPGDLRQIQVWLVNYSGASATVYVDTGKLYRGHPPTTIGDILQSLLDDANVDHTGETAPYDRAGFPFLDYTSFDAVNDSNGDPWDDSEISLAVRRGRTMLEVMGVVGELGYEWEVISDPASDGSWLLNVYNPGGLGSDLSAADHPALVVGQSTVGGPITRRHVNGNWVLAEGRYGHLAVAENTTQQAAIGLTERYRQTLESADLASTQLVADEQLADNLDAGLGMTFRVRPIAGQSAPYTDYTRGDIIQTEDPGKVTRAARRVAAIGGEYTADTGLTYIVSISSQALSGMTAIASGTARLLRKLQDIPEQTETAGQVNVTGGKGGMWTVSVAASDARDTSKASADYVCDGVDDHEEIVLAYTLITAIKGRVVLSEGTFTDLDLDVIFLPDGVSMVGMGIEATRLDFNSGSGVAIDLGADSTIDMFSFKRGIPL